MKLGFDLSSFAMDYQASLDESMLSKAVRLEVTDQIVSEYLTATYAHVKHRFMVAKDVLAGK